MPQISESEHQSHQEQICVHLRADRALAPRVSEALISMIETAYNNMGDTSFANKQHKASKNIH
jgi:hypothetical protein